VLGLVIQDPRTLGKVQGLVIQTFPADVAVQIQSTLRSASDNVGRNGLIGLAGLLFTGSGLFGGMEEAFTRVYRAPYRGLIVRRVLWLAMMLLFFVLLLLAVAASSASTFLLNRTADALPFDLPGWAYLQTWVGYAVSFGSLLLLFIAIYWIMPNVKLSLWKVLPGALLATVGFGLATLLVPVYLQYFGASYQAYAAFGLLLLLMFWFYILGNIIVLGAELNSFLFFPHLRESITRPAPAHPTTADVHHHRAEPAPPRQPAAHSASTLWGALLFLFAWDRLKGGRRG
jgi:membrane protein